MESKNGWAFVALYNGKKVNKYVTTCRELDNYEWITEIKFWFRDENDTYCEGIVLAKGDSEQTLQKMIMKKNPRCPSNAFIPFPDPNLKPIDMVGKWKKRLATISMNDLPISGKCNETLGNEKTVNNRGVTSVEFTTHKDRNGPATSSTLENPKKHHLIELQQEEKSIDFASNQLNTGNGKPINETNETETSSEVSSEESELLPRLKNDMQYIRKRKRTLHCTTPEKRVITKRFVTHSNPLKKKKKEALNKNMVSKKKYNKLLYKYRLINAILIEQKNDYMEDLKIQHLAQCLYKAIEKRYDEDEEEESEDD